MVTHPRLVSGHRWRGAEGSDGRLKAVRSENLASDKFSASYPRAWCSTFTAVLTGASYGAPHTPRGAARGREVDPVPTELLQPHHHLVCDSRPPPPRWVVLNAHFHHSRMHCRNGPPPARSSPSESANAPSRPVHVLPPQSAPRTRCPAQHLQAPELAPAPPGKLAGLRSHPAPSSRACAARPGKLPGLRLHPTASPRACAYPISSLTAPGALRQSATRWAVV